MCDSVVVVSIIKMNKINLLLCKLNKWFLFDCIFRYVFEYCLLYMKKVSEK